MKTASALSLLVVLTACGGHVPSSSPLEHHGGERSEPALMVPADVELDDHDALRERIAAEVATARDGRGRSVEVHVRTTADYGCRCSPFVFAPFHNGPDPFVMLIARPAELPPADLVGGTIRVIGHFDGRILDGEAWAASIGYPIPSGPDVQEGWSHRGPALVVERWCWEEPPPSSDDATFYAERFAALRRDGKTCSQ